MCVFSLSKLLMLYVDGLERELDLIGLRLHVAGYTDMFIVGAALTQACAYLGKGSMDRNNDDLRARTR